MDTERRLRILARLVANESSALEPTRLCDVCAELTSTSGASILLIANGTSRGSVCSTDSVSDRLEELQFTLGEGPGLDACRTGEPVLEPDLGFPAFDRWLAFTPQAIAVGAAAVFGFPIRVGAASLGALQLHRDRPGPLTDEQHADALVLADVAAEMILLMQAKASPGELAAELESSARLHYVVHQAAGMVSAQLETTVDVALVRLRAFAFSNGQPLVDVARSVVERRLRFDPNDETGTRR